MRPVSQDFIDAFVVSRVEADALKLHFGFEHIYPLERQK
jgi:hypothetical protein